MALSGGLAVFVEPLGWQAPVGDPGDALGIALALPLLLIGPPLVVAGAGPAGRPLGGDLSFGRLGLAYFLQGLGYIVSGTFAVRAVQQTPALADWAPWVWVATGLAAAPSAWLWAAVARRLGSRWALVAAFMLQAAGMALPAVSSSAWAAHGRRAPLRRHLHGHRHHDAGGGPPAHAGGGGAGGRLAHRGLRRGADHRPDGGRLAHPRRSATRGRRCSRRPARWRVGGLVLVGGRQPALALHRARAAS